MTGAGREPAEDIEDGLRLALGGPTVAFSIDDNHVELDGDIVRRR